MTSAGGLGPHVRVVTDDTIPFGIDFDACICSEECEKIEGVGVPPDESWVKDFEVVVCTDLCNLCCITCVSEATESIGKLHLVSSLCHWHATLLA